MKHVATELNVISDTISRHVVLRAGGAILTDLARVLSCPQMQKVAAARGGMRVLRLLTQQEAGRD